MLKYRQQSPHSIKNSFPGSTVASFDVELRREEYYNTDEQAIHFPTEFLNWLDLPGMHVLQLKNQNSRTRTERNWNENGDREQELRTRTGTRTGTKGRNFERELGTKTRNGNSTRSDIWERDVLLYIKCVQIFKLTLTLYFMPCHTSSHNKTGFAKNLNF